MRSLLAFATALLAACSSYDGRGLVPGQSTGAQVEALMGAAAERITTPAGETVLFFPRAPQGRHTFAARIAPNGTLVALDQTLTKENMARVVPEKSTKKDVRELLGPPYQTYRTRDGLEGLDYRVDVDMRWYDFLVDVSADGIVRKAYLLHDPFYDAPCAC
jgi:hypothetical protein